MNNATITFRTDETLKNQATEVFDSMGMSLSTALNIFMRQAVILKRYPCSIDASSVNIASSTYPQGFFELFGTGNGLGFDEEPSDEVPVKEIML